MDARERVALALDHKEPDRIPIDYWAVSEVNARLMEHFGLSTQEEILQHFDVDFRYIEGPKYIGPEPAVHPDGAVEDHWGVPRARVQVGEGESKGSYSEVTVFPLEEATSVQEIREYPKWPDPDWFDFSCVAEQVAEARKTGKVIIFMGDRLNRCAQLKPAMYVRGVSQILLDVVINPEIAAEMFRRIAAFYMEYARRTFEAADGGIDIFMTGDDFGQQNGPLLSPEMWRRFIQPGFKAFIDLGHEYGCKVAHHTCGSVKAIIPDIIESGLDILNPVQPDVRDMEYDVLKSEFGGRLCFHGAISIQKTLPFGTPDDVRNEVRDRAEKLGPNGGFIFCTAHNIQADTSIENVEALFDAYQKFGRYCK